ncbi:MAG: FtsQ-type POTRA domain-containing protein [Actinomycetota bacterium]
MRKRRFQNALRIALAILLVVVLGYFLGWSKVLAIKSIEVTADGNEQLVAPLIIPKDLHIGLPMARVSSQRIKHDLASMRWIDKISINRRWFAHDLRITITEHQAIAQYVDSRGTTQYFDSQGYSFASPNPPSGLPLITFDHQNQESRDAVAKFLSAVPTDLTVDMTSFYVDSLNQILLTTSIPGYQQLVISWGTATDIPLKTKVLRQLLTLSEIRKLLALI